MHKQKRASLVLVVEIAENIGLAEMMVEEATSIGDFLFYFLFILKSVCLPADVISYCLPKGFVVWLKFGL